MKITKAFHAELKSRWEQAKSGTHEIGYGEKLTYEEWGKKLAKVAGRPRAFDKGQVQRFIENNHTSLEVLEAICSYFKIPSPLIEPESISEVEWFTAGQLLARLNRREFDRLLRIAKEKAESELEIHQLDRGGGIDPEG